MIHASDRERCDAIFASARLHGNTAALGMWKLLQMEDGLDPVVLELAARGDRFHEEVVEFIRDYEGTERMMKKHGIVLKNPGELEELLRRMKPKVGQAYTQGIPVAPPRRDDEKDDRATAMLHMFSGLGSGKLK